MEEIPVTLEEPWTDLKEGTLRGWQAQSEIASRAHRSAGYRLKFKHRLLGFILLFWSGVVLVVNGLLVCENDIATRAVRLTVDGIQIFWAGLNSALDLGAAYRIHFEFEAKYANYALDIEHVLSRERDFREAADAFMTEMRERQKLLSMAPEFPMSRYFFC
jgi:hypothetical protein